VNRGGAAARGTVRLLPNAVTVLALCSGLSSVRFAGTGQFGLAVGAIVLAAVFDALDGRLARLLDATSKMGAELDSLADSISFGVSPALVLYFWAFPHGRAGWTVCLVFVVCVVLRLARFNILTEDADQPPYAKEFFIGVPSPAGALLALAPLALTLQVGDGWWARPVPVAVWMVLIGLLMIGRMRTLSLRAVRVPPAAVAPVLVVVGLTAAFVISTPFLALLTAMLIYLLHLPYATYRSHWLARNPETWTVPPRQRRAVRRAQAARLGLRRPLRRRVAGVAGRAAARSAGTMRRRTDHVNGFQPPDTAGPAGPDGRPHRGVRGRQRGPRKWRRLGLRR
jgi:CDP-diacylglycerol--serine O-phosphatidyltransferase